MTLNLSELTVVELKNMCKKKKIKGYSLLIKNDLIKLLKKHIKKGGIIIDSILHRPKRKMRQTHSNFRWLEELPSVKSTDCLTFSFLSHWE
jgi:hypothetical protein